MTGRSITKFPFSSAVSYWSNWVDAGRVPPHIPFNKHILSLNWKLKVVPFVLWEEETELIINNPWGYHIIGYFLYWSVLFVKPTST